MPVPLFRWVGTGWKAGRLRRRARRTADPNARAELLLEAAKLDGLPGVWLEAAVALAQAGRLDQSAESWRRAIEIKPVLVPAEAQIAALFPVFPRVAGQVLDGLTGDRRGFLDHFSKLERRGSADGEERWRLEQDRYGEMKELLPTLRYIALAVAHTAGAPGRLRIDCDRKERDSDTYLDIAQLGEVIIAWDENRAITSVRVQE